MLLNSNLRVLTHYFSNIVLNCLPLLCCTPKTTKERIGAKTARTITVLAQFLQPTIAENQNKKNSIC